MEDEDLELRYAEAVAIGEDLVEAEPDSATYLSDLVGLLANRGIYLGQLGQTDAMRADFERSVELGEALLSDHPGLVDRLEVFALACNNLATARSDEGLHEEALDLTRRARELHQEILERAPSALRLGELGFVECNLGSLLSFLGQYDEAIEVLDAGTGHLDQALVSVPERFDFVAAREAAHLHFGQAWIGLGDEERAVEAIAPLQASSDWRIVSRALDVYQGAVERVEGQEAGHEDAEGVLGSYLDASASYLLACLEAGLQPPPVLGDPARYGVLLGYAPFEDAVRAGLR